MTKNEMWNNYKSIAGAHTYIIGFALNGQVYAIERKRFTNLLSYEKASRGQGMAIRLRLRVADKKRLMARAYCVGSIEELSEGIYNKGENFERLIYRHFCQEWHKDTKAFTECGDICVDGVEIQIKFDGATFTNEKTLARQLARVA